VLIRHGGHQICKTWSSWSSLCADSARHRPLVTSSVCGAFPFPDPQQPVHKLIRVLSGCFLGVWQRGSIIPAQGYKRTRSSSRGSSNTQTRSPVRRSHTRPSLCAEFSVLLSERPPADLFFLPRLTPDTSGTCSMLPRDKGGVVDPRLKVSNV